jgi:hypothetical protein
VKTLVEAVKTSVKWGESEPFEKFGAAFYDKPLEACAKVLHYLHMAIWYLTVCIFQSACLKSAHKGKWFCYAAYNSPKFYGFINCTL